MKISREWCMPNKNTFTIKPIKELLARYTNKGVWVDPMAGNFSPAMCKNDIDKETNVETHKDATEYLKTFCIQSIDGVLFDPPYSPRQVSECYKKLGLTVNMETTQSSYWRKIKDEIDKVVKKGGYVISFGWNSNGMGKTRGYEIVEILLVAHGGNHNDTICLIEKKIKMKICNHLFRK